jgi:hypothetical protein
MYNGLGGYSREKADPAARKKGESDTGWARRLNTFHRADQVEQAQGADPTDEQRAAWNAHRAAIAASGSDSGIFGNMTGQELAAARGLVGAGHGGEQRPEKLGHLASTAVRGSVAVSRVYSADLGEAAPAASPVLEHLRSSGEGIFTSRG